MIRDFASMPACARLGMVRGDDARNRHRWRLRIVGIDIFRWWKACAGMAPVVLRSSVSAAFQAPLSLIRSGLFQ